MDRFRVSPLTARVGVRRYAVLVASAFVFPLVAGCSSDEPTAPIQVEDRAAAVNVTPSIVNLDVLGQSVQLTAIAVDSSGNPIEGKAFTWTSSDVQVVVVDAVGMATAAGKGSAIVSARADGLAGTSNIQVQQPPPGPQDSAQLVFTVQPSLTASGSVIAPAVVVEITDSTGVRLVNANDAVTLTIDANPGGASVTGTTTLSATAGVATFADLVLDRAGFGYTLLASSGGMSAGTSQPFGVCQPPFTGMVGWWRGDGDATDGAGSIDGTAQAGATYGPGLVDQAFDLTSGGYVAVPDNSVLNPGSVTVAAWIRRSARVGSQDPVVKKVGAGAGTADAGYALEFDGDDVLFAGYPQPAQGRFETAGTFIPLDEWTHVVGTYSDPNLRLYVNGMLMDTQKSDAPLEPSGNELRIGGDASNPGRSYQGLIDEVAVFDRELTGGEVTMLYTAGAAGMCK